MIFFKKIFFNFILIIISFFISFLIVEFFLKNFYPQNLSGSWRIIHESGLMLNKNIGSSEHIWGSGTADKINIKYSFGKYHNRLYKNQSRNYSKDKILILGDSFTFGWLLEDKDTFVYNIQRNINNKLFINAASGGWGMADYVKYTELFCKEIAPTEVWVFLNNSDVDRANNSNLYKLDSEGNLDAIIHKKTNLEKLKFILNSYLFYDLLLEKSHAIQFIRNSLLRFYNVNLASNKIEDRKNYYKNILLGKALLTRLKKETTSCGANLKIFYLGWPLLFMQSDEMTHFIKLIKEEDFILKNDIMFYDLSLTKEMKDVQINLNKYSLKEQHPNKKGNQKILSAILSVIN